MLFETQTCREYLKGELEERIRTNPRYSQRSFARQLGMSPGELSEILRGKRTLTWKKADSIAGRLGLSEGERRHFVDLLNAERTGRVQDASPLNSDHFWVISDWYCLSLLHLTETEGFKWNDEWLAKRLGISPLEVRLSKERLLRVGLLVEKNGRLATDKKFEVKSSVPSEAIRKFHKQMLQKAISAIDNQSIDERELLGSTLAIDPDHLPALKKALQKFVNEFSNKFGSTKKKKEVYQLETILFRLSYRVTR